MGLSVYFKQHYRNRPPFIRIYVKMNCTEVVKLFSYTNSLVIV